MMLDPAESILSSLFGFLANVDALQNEFGGYTTRLLSALRRFVSDAHEFMLSDPLTAFLIGLIILALLGIICLRIIQYLRKPSDRLLRSVKKCEKVSVLMHDNPDPDAMACALAMKRLLTEVGTDAELIYTGKISHHENRAFRAVLDVSFDSISHADEISGEKVILVDHFQPRGFMDSEDVEPNIVVDHHSGTPDEKIKEEADFWFIDSDLGACSTILTQFLNEQGLKFKKEENDDEADYVSETIVTALFYGIMSDTNDLTQGVTEDDYYAAISLYNGVHTDKLHRISTPKIDGSALETKARAIMGRDVRGPFAVSDVGDVQNPDSIPQAADELVQLEGVSAVVVFGSTDDEIRISGRAYDDRVHLGDALASSIEDIPKASAGGHSEMGGGAIPKNVFDHEDLTRNDLVERFFSVLNGNE